ncbi:MAG: hypothetical protein U0Z26_18560 [Anaerolineales bacterium]
MGSALQVLSGDVAGFVYRQQSDGSVVLAKRTLPDPNREFSEAQEEQQQKFKDASARYRRLIEDADILESYQKLVDARGSKSRMRAIVMGDILKAPKVSTIDLSGYQGMVGDPIRVIAEDSVGVCKLSLSVFDVTGNDMLESAEMAMNGQVLSSVEWVYQATVAAVTGHQIEVRVTAADLAGNVSTDAKSN